MPNILLCFCLKKKASKTVEPAQVVAYEAKRISAEIERRSDDEFTLRVRGFEEDDPIIKTKRTEQIKRREEAIEAQRKEEEEAFRQRMERY
jgi:hypothetical protein